MVLILKSLAFAIAVLIPVAYGNNGLTCMHILSAYSISILTIITGRQFSSMLGFRKFDGFANPYEIILGFSALSFLELMLINLLKFDAMKSFYIAGLIILIFALANKRCLAKKNNSISECSLRATAQDSGVLILISILTTIWCRELITSLNDAYLTGVYRVWPDIFLHASEIVSLQNYSVLTSQSLYLAGTEKSFYHVASYAISSFFAASTGESALKIAADFWTPVGITLMGLGVYGFGCLLAGRVAGFLAIAAVFLLPDSSMYGLKVGFFGFHWLMQISPGSGYAMALIFIALGMYVLGVREGKFNLVLWSLPVVILSSVFRVQLAAPALIMTVILAKIVWQPKKQWHDRAFYIISFTVLISIIFLFESIELAPHFLSGEYNASKFFQALHSRVLTSPYGASTLGHIYQSWIESSPALLNWIIGYAIFLMTALGLIFPIIFILTILKIYSKNEWKVNVIPIILFLACFMIIVFLPVPMDGDYSNFGHRQFVLMYALSITFIAAWVVECYKKKRALKHHDINKIGLIVILPFLFFGLSVPWINGKGIQQPNGWADHITSNAIPAGLFNVTNYIFTHSYVSDWVLSSNMDPLATIVALTERPAYLSREGLYTKFDGRLNRVFNQRKIEFSKLSSFKRFDDLSSFAIKNNIKWFIKFPNELSNWSQDILKCSTYQSEGFYVFKFYDSECK